eukprot:5846678-Amphidinium_carterae.1
MQAQKGCPRANTFALNAMGLIHLNLAWTGPSSSSEVGQSPSSFTAPLRVSAAVVRVDASALSRETPARCGASEAMTLPRISADCAVDEGVLATHAPPLIAANRMALVQSTWSQPRDCKVAQVITEYALKMRIPCGELPVLNEKRRTTTAHPTLPSGSHLLSCSTEGLANEQTESDACCPVCGALPLSCGAKDCTARWFEFGVYRSPLEWHLVALQVPFPMDVVPFLRPWQ